MSAAMRKVMTPLQSHGCRQSGNDWRCPVHDDTTPSLSVSEGDDGRVLTPKPWVLRSIRFGGQGGSRPEVKQEDYCLKSQVFEMLAHFDRLGDGKITSLDVKDGLPCHMIVEDQGSE